MEAPNILQIAPCTGIYAEFRGAVGKTVLVVAFGKMPKNDAGAPHPWVPLVYSEARGALTTLQDYSAELLAEAKANPNIKIDLDGIELIVRLVTKD